MNEINNSKTEQRKIVVYTGIFGKYDNLKSVPFHPYIDYICLSDSLDAKFKGWEIRRVNLEFKNSILSNRYVKFNPHLFFPDYEISVYIDGNVIILSDIYAFSHSVLQRYDMAAPRHPSRDFVVDEFEACINLKKINREVARKQIKFYLNNGLSSNAKLTENNVLFRRHNSLQVRKTGELWWSEFNKWSPRDQLSLAYCANQHILEINILDWDSRGSSSHFYAMPHKGDLLVNKLRIYLKYFIKILKYKYFGMNRE